MKTTKTKRRQPTSQTWIRWSLPLLSVLSFIGILFLADVASAEGGLAEFEGTMDDVTDTAKKLKTKFLVLVSVIFAAGSGLAGLAYLKSEGEGRERVLNVFKGIVAVYVLLLISGTCVPTS